MRIFSCNYGCTIGIREACERIRGYIQLRRLHTLTQNTTLVHKEDVSLKPGLQIINPLKGYQREQTCRLC
uniref:Putative ovule protein n=1 Tax=Solanum chacoense TaxID=4108 RepID=A0A0V0GNE1_SOLCH